MSEIRVEVISTDQNFQILNVLITGNGLTSPSILNDIKIPNNLDPTKGVVVYGKGPIWLHSYLVHECHHTSWVATFDPRKGGVVVQTHSENGPFVGDIIPSEQINQYIKKQAISKKSYQFENKKKKIAFLGPPHSGKSVFMRLLADELYNYEGLDDEFYIIRACPDGEGNWYSDIPEEQGKIYRMKSDFDDEFPISIAKDLEEIEKSKKFVFVDCGGKIDKKNQLILNQCTHAIIISSQHQLVNEWLGASKASDLIILSIIDSKLEEVSEISALDPLRFNFGKLERSGKCISKIPIELINLIIEN